MEQPLTTANMSISAAAALEKKVHSILNDVLSVTAIEEAFTGFLVHSEEEEQNKKKLCRDMFCQFWKAHAQQSGETILNIYVTHMFQLHSQKISLLFDILSYCVEKGYIQAKMVCDALLSNPNLDYKSKEVWRRSFQLIYGIIKHIDYKGCRDLLKVLLEKIQLIPASVNIAYKNEMTQIKQVIALILDRQKFLLPAYFAVTEIQVIFPDSNLESGHWIVGEMLGAYVESFRAVARMVLITGRPHLLPIIGHSNTSGNAWKLDPHTLTFVLKGNLPFDKDQMKPQFELIRYALKQPYSRDTVCNIISLNKQLKQRSAVLEGQLAELVMVAMERSEQDMTAPADRYGTPLHALWQHLSSQLIIFALFQFVNFPDVVELLYKKLKGRNLTKGRDYLMWLLLQFISGSMKKNPLHEFLPILKLFELLYQETEPLPVPDVSYPSCVHGMAMACVWPHLLGKAALEKKTLPCPIPKVLKLQYEFLRKSSKTPNLPLTDYRIALMCNAYSTTTDLFQAPLNILMESFYNPKSPPVLLPGPSNNMAAGPTEPLSMTMLDSLSTHTKLSFIHHIATNKIGQVANRNTTLALSPAMMETYSRLLVYVELESLGIKTLISQVYSNVVDNQAWGTLHSILELINYRMHHIQPHYRIQLLCSLHSLSALPQTKHNQLYHCIESTALKIITSLGSSEVQPQLSRFLNDPKQLLSTESEELNRALVLTLARAIHVTGSETLSWTWCRGILEKLQTNTPHNWATHTLRCFPSSLQQFFEQNATQMENRTGLKELVDESYRSWSGLTTDQDKVAYFTGKGVSPHFLCIVWKILLERDHIPGIIVKILEQMSPASMSAQIRCFADYLVQEFSTSAGGEHINKCVEKLNDMVWKLNIVTLDKLVLCLALRSHEGNEAQVCFFIIQLLILKPNEFRSRVIDFVKDNSPEHWKQSDWHTQHMAYHKNYPENFFFEGLCEKAGTTFSNPPQYYPVYFSNVCLRFLPVFDILIHRFLELPPVSKSLETLLEHLGSLFKFHDRPVTYLYNTLHFFEKKLRDRPHLKKKLVGTIIGAQKTVKPLGWCLSVPYLEYLNRHGEDANWEPNKAYYVGVIGRLVDTMGEKPAFPNFDWRFNEFPNANSHALYVTCMELMALPSQPKVVGNALLNILLTSGSEDVPRKNVMGWINAIALVLTSLPECYWEVIQEHILQTLRRNPQMSDSIPLLQQDLKSIFSSYDFVASYTCQAETMPAYLMAITHAVWHHSNIGQLTLIPRFLKEQVKPMVKTEGQFLFACCLIGPLLQRFHEERTRCLMEIAVEIYEMLGNMDKNCTEIVHIDAICDFLYHIKYRFAGDSIKSEAEQVIRGLKPQLSKGLRFISKSRPSAPAATTPEDPNTKIRQQADVNAMHVH